METFKQWMETLNGWVWGSSELVLSPMMVLLLGAGLFLTVGLRFMSITKVGYAFKQLFKKRTGDAEEGDVSPFPQLSALVILRASRPPLRLVAPGLFFGCGSRPYSEQPQNLQKVF